MAPDCAALGSGQETNIVSKTVRTLTLHLALAALAAMGVFAPLSLARAEYANPHGVAVIIGNKAYRNERVPEVAYAYRDAEAFRRFVLDVLGFDPENVIDLRDATQAELEAAFGNERSHEGRVWRYLHPRHGSDVVVYYSGHGVPGLKNGRGYLLPSDADPDAPEINGYPIDLLYANLGKLAEAKSVRLYLDASFSGDGDQGASPPAASGEKLTALSAASGTEVASWDHEAEHGLFTLHLLNALYGAGDRDANGRVTALEAKSYLDDTMTLAALQAHGRQQHANLVGNTGAVLSQVGSGGAFPPRPGFDGFRVASNPRAHEGDRADPAGGAGELTPPPVETADAEEKALDLTHAERVLVQHGLASLGEDVGVADGVFGRRTRAGIERYQRKKGLAATGYLTGELRDALVVLGKARQAEEGRRAETAAREAERERQAAALRSEKERGEAAQKAEAALRVEEEHRGSGRVLPVAPAEYANPYGVAVIIGNRTYGGDIPAVDFAHRDAEAFRRYVLDVLGFDPENIIDLRDTTQAEMWSTFGSRTTADRSELWSYLADEGSDVVVFYSGHGVPGIDDERGYLLPVNADPNTAELNGYPIDVLFDNLANLKLARSIAVYVDACFSGGSGGGGMLIEGASPVYVEASLPDTGTERLTVLTAASDKQLASWDRKARHGLFTHHLLEALHGKADRDADGRVTAREAKAYLDRYMTRAAKRTWKRRQRAGLMGNADAVLAKAGAGGAFPPRPALESGGTAPGEAEEGAAVPAEAALGLTFEQRVLVQHGLASLGHDVGVPDGVLGKRSRSGLRSYQRKKGLPETGYLTAELRDALAALGEEARAAKEMRGAKSAANPGR